MTTVSLPKPEAVVLELTGVIATRSFMAYSEESKHFARQHIDRYFQQCYPRQKNLRLDVNFFKDQQQKDEQENKNVACPKIPAILKPVTREIVQNVINHIVWKINNDFSSPPVSYFMYHITEWGYGQGFVQTPVYSEVVQVFDSWKAMNIEIYVTVASGSFVNMVLSATTLGNIAHYFSGHMNLMQFENNKLVKMFDRLPEMLGKEVDKILFITRFPLDARIASKNKISTVLVLREDFDPQANEKIAAAKIAVEQVNVDKKAQTPAAEEDMQLTSSPVSGLIDVKSALQLMTNSKDVSKQIDSDTNSLNIEEIGSAMLLFESTTSLQPKTNDLDVRVTDSRIIVSDIRELLVVQNLNDIQFY